MHVHTGHSHDHDHGDDHDHDDGHGHELGHAPRSGRDGEGLRLWLTLLLSLGTMAAEAIGGWLTHSLALLSDAGHMLTDVSAIALSMVALRFATRPADPKKTYGYYRLEILAALTNGMALILISIVIAWEAVDRLRNPVPVHVGPMVWIALAGLVSNGLGAQLLGHSHNLNVRGVFLHMVGDLLASAGVLAAAIIMWRTNWWLADPIISIVVSLIILVGSYRLVRESVDVLLEATPAHLDHAAIEAALREVSSIKAVHDLHVWTISTGMYALSAHVVIERARCSESDAILKTLKDVLCERFQIDHTTLQIESDAYAHHGEEEEPHHLHRHEPPPA